MTSIKLTNASKELLVELWQDLGNWGGDVVLINGNVQVGSKRRGNLSDLIQKGLIELEEDDDKYTWASLTFEGVSYVNNLS